MLAPAGGAALQSRRLPPASRRTRLAPAAFCAGALLLAPAHSRAQAQDHQYGAAEIQAGARLYFAQCQLCHGENGERVAGVDLRRGQFRRVSSDEEIRRVIANGTAQGSGMPPSALQPAELDALVAYIRAGFDTGGTAVKVGDARRGRELFAGKGQCGSCHRVDGLGPRVAPDLSDIGAQRPPAAIQRSLLEPSRAMWPINRPVRAVTRDGRTVRGRRLNEDTFTVQLIDDQERLVSLEKSELREFEAARDSEMPSFAGKLSAEELAALLAYLLSLKGKP
jgi:putative heme-binding domain-containing protein